MDIIELTNEQKFEILEQKRLKRNELVKLSYHRRTAEGRNTRTIADENKKTRGRKPKVMTLEELEKTNLKLSSKMGRPPGPSKKRIIVEPMVQIE
jgi:hypothetical protein